LADHAPTTSIFSRARHRTDRTPPYY